MNSSEYSPTSLSQNIIFITRMRGLDKAAYQKNIKNENNLDEIKPNIYKSKISLLKNNRSEPKLVNSNRIKDNIKYTMFTSNNSSNIMLVSKKPIKGSTINEALKVCNNLYEFHNSILNETSLLEYDKIYNETHSIDKIYNEVIKDNLSQLFHKKNSCIIFFGPSTGGKSYLLLGDNIENGNNYYHKINYNNKYNYNGKPNNDNKIKLEGGLLKRSIKNILNLIKINKQGNDDKSNIQNKYELRLSIYLVYMDKIYDLLTKKINNISIQKYYGDDQSININLVGLTELEIRSVEEYEKAIKEVESNRKNLSQTLKVKNINKNSQTVISLKLQKKIQNTLGNSVSDNYSINCFSQIDFIELSPSEIGLNDKFQDNNDLSYEYNLYNNTKNVFNSICDNIVSAKNGTTPKKECMLTLSLKNTLKTNSNIIFFNCVIPWENPINHSFKALKFTTWLRNQVINEGENINNNISLNNIINQSLNPNYNPNSNINNNNLFNNINDNTNSSTIIYPNINNSYLTTYNNPLVKDNSNLNKNLCYTNQNYNTTNNNIFPDINKLVAQSESTDNGKNNNNILINEEQNENNNFNIDEEQNIKLIRSSSGGININNKSNETNKPTQNSSYIYKNNNISNNQNNKSQYINISENLSTNEKTLQTLEKTLKELEEKKLEIEKKMILEKNNNYSDYNTNINMPLTSTNLINPETQRLKEEQDILKSDNIIMREDINRLNEINENLETEINQSRDIISKLQTENQSLTEENSQLKNILNDYDNHNYSQLYINGQISKEDFLEKSFNERFQLQSKLKDLQNNYDNLQKEKTQYEVDFKVLLSKYDELKEKYEKCNYELLNSKQIHDNELYNIDSKINGLSKEIEKLQTENSELRQDNESFRSNLNMMTSERDMYKDKFEDQKYKNDLLNKKIFEVENGYNQMMKEKEYEKYYKKQKEDNHRNKSETKTRIAQELQSKIQQYRRERLQRKNNEDFD